MGVSNVQCEFLVKGLGLLNHPPSFSFGFAALVSGVVTPALFMVRESWSLG